jgi:hypothetical protein
MKNPYKNYKMTTTMIRVFERMTRLKITDSYQYKIESYIQNYKFSKNERIAPVTAAMKIIRQIAAENK